MKHTETGLTSENKSFITNCADSTSSKVWLCILNPNAGAASKLKLQAQFINYLKQQPNTKVIIWDDKFNFKPVEAFIVKYEYIVAIGGDGTVNKIAQAILGTTKKLGIIPIGSGNGLARTLGISTNPYKAWNQLQRAKPFLIDVGLCNKNIFLCTAGVGFDAEVAQLFSKSTKRGYLAYIGYALKRALKYKPIDLQITSDTFVFNAKVFMVTCCNAGQFGNDFYIAPDAKLNDGELNLIIIPAFNLIRFFKIIFALRVKSTKSYPYIIRQSVTSVNIKASTKGPYHVDGDALQHALNIDFNILPKHLYVLK
jgi:diacylglycerol kinase (ATP)